MTTSGPLREFYAVTRSSLFRVSSDRVHGVPVVIKIKTHDQDKTQVGRPLQEAHAAGGPEFYVGLLGEPSGLVMYVLATAPDALGKTLSRLPRPDEVNPAYYGGRTSPLVALLLREDEASVCFGFGNLNTTLDARWVPKTRETIDAITDGHPVFILGQKLRPYLNGPRRTLIL